MNSTSKIVRLTTYNITRRQMESMLRHETIQELEEGADILSIKVIHGDMSESEDDCEKEEEIVAQVQVIGPAEQQCAEDDYDLQPEDEPRYRVGSKVHHPKYGVCRVSRIGYDDDVDDGDGEDGILYLTPVRYDKKMPARFKPYEVKRESVSPVEDDDE